jgi:hypothetical protein
MKLTGTGGVTAPNITGNQNLLYKVISNPGDVHYLEIQLTGVANPAAGIWQVTPVIFQLNSTGGGSLCAGYFDCKQRGSRNCVLQFWLSGSRGRA